MDFEKCIKRIEKYLSKPDVQPVLIDVQNQTDLGKLSSYFDIGRNKVISLSKYCREDEFPRLEDFFTEVKQSPNTSIVKGLTVFLRLLGEKELNKRINELLGMTPKAHVIVITYQCERYIEIPNRHLSKNVWRLDGDADIIPELYFCKSDLLLPATIQYTNGLQNLLLAIENMSVSKVYLLTNKTKANYPEALYSITDINDAYDILTLKDIATKKLSKSLGTKAQWNYALKKLQKYDSWYSLIKAEVGDPENLDKFLAEQPQMSLAECWLYFISLKLYGAKNNPYFNEAVSTAKSQKQLIANLYQNILKKNFADSDYWDYYESRKRILRQLKVQNDEVELTSYCEWVKSKGKNAIFYLTDVSQQEKEAIFVCLDAYGQDYKREKLLVVLQKIYPDLYFYLQPYNFQNLLLNQYFQEYKYQKVINKLFPEFYQTVLDQAEKREYNLILEPRASNIEKLTGPNTKLYFVDAMGVEYLSYIKTICTQLQLSLNIKVCRAELPTITEKNDEFYKQWDGKKENIKELDDIKHHGKHGYDYYHHSKLPIHLIEELDDIHQGLKNIQAELVTGKADKAVIIADHGASRLCVLYDKENIWEMAQKGEHSGRCCLKSEIDEQPTYAADAGDYWALANYDRFKGGRKANVEVHGGATLEEICVPIITIRYSDKQIGVAIKSVGEDNITDIPEITVSYRKKAVIDIFMTEEQPDINVKVYGKHLADNGCYDAVRLEGKSNYYRVNMPGVKRAGDYEMDVYSGDNLIAEKLPFVVKKEGQQERKLL